MFRLCAICLSLAALAAQSPEWRALPLIEDGKIHPAWAQVDWGRFVVDEGALRTEPDERGMGLLVYTREKFGDCRIRVIYRAEKPRSNAGVFVRIDDGILARIGEKSPPIRRGANGKLSPEMLARLQQSSARQLGAWYAVHHGFEVQIQDAADPLHRTGAVYSLSEAEPVPASPPSEWRTMIISLEGERIAVEVDGKRVSTVDTGSANLPPRRQWFEPMRDPKRLTRGYIGLQSHDPGDVVWYKEIAVSRL